MAVFILGMLVVAAGAVFFGTQAASPDGAGGKGDAGTFAEIRIHSTKPKLLFEVDPRDQAFETYRRTHGKLLKAFFVLQSAVRQPDIARLEFIQRQDRPVEWLEENLVVEFPDTEFIRLSLRGHQSAEAAAILNAVVDAYMREVVNKEDEGRRVRLTELEKIAAGVAREVDRLETDRRRQRELMAAAPIPEIELLDLDLMRHEYTHLRLKRVGLDASVAANATQPGPEATEAAAEPDPQRRQLETVERQIQAFESEFRAVLDRRTASSKSQITLDEIDRQIASKEKILEQLREQIERLTIELNAPIGISVFREATAAE